MDSNNENRDNTWKDEEARSAKNVPKETTTLNLDTGEVEPLEDLEDKNAMDFGSGSGGGSATDGGAS